MQLKKINELLNIHSEIYNFSEFNSHIITNKMYDAIDVFDIDLKIKQTIKLSEDFIIDNAFFSQDTTQFALYNSEENLLAFCDITKNDAFYVFLPKKSPMILSHLYSWANATLAICTYRGTIVTFHNRKVTIIEDIVDIQKSFSELYNFSKHLQNFSKTFQINFANKSFISVDEISRIVTFNSLEKKIALSVPEPDINYHDIIFTEDIFVIISENEVVIKSQDNSISIPSNPGEIFLRGAFIKTIDLYLYLLVSHKGNQSLSSIIKYDLS